MNPERQFPLQWPAGWKRTQNPQPSRFDTSPERATRGLLAEIERLGGRLPVISSNAQYRQDPMSARLSILEKSLDKKQTEFDARLSIHFGDVAAANGQPLNDKRGGDRVLARWDKQNEALHRLNQSIDRTKSAIERERSTISRVAAIADSLPPAIATRIADGTLTQWRKHPKTFFVAGVDGARIVLLDGPDPVGHRYLSSITDADQRRVFAQTFNSIAFEMRGAP